MMCAVPHCGVLEQRYNEAVRWLGGIGALLVLGLVVLLVREVRSPAAPAQAKGDERRPGDSDKDSAPIQSSDNPRPSKPGTVVAERDGSRSSPNAPSLRPGTPNVGGGGAVADTTEPSMDVDDPNHPVWAKQNGEEPSAWRVRVRIGQLALDRGNYKGALRQVDPIITDDPTFTDAYRVAIPALCAMGDLTTARQYYGRFTRETDRKDVTEACTNLGATLNP
jgi:hypothetical protein